MLELNAVIFDMDGLMIDTEPVGKMLVKTSHEKFGYEITEETFYHLIGTNEKTSKAYYHSVFGEDYPYQKIKDYRDQLRKEYFNSHPLEVKKGLYDLLEDLKKKNINDLYILSCNAGHLSKYTKGHNVASAFSCIVSGNVHAYDGNVAFGKGWWDANVNGNYSSRLSNDQSAFHDIAKTYGTDRNPVGYIKYYKGKYIR